MNKIDHNREFNRIIEALDREYAAYPSDDTVYPAPKKLLLHACCAPCSSICMERVRDHFDTAVYFYNPNITDPGEYEFRLAELRRLIDIYNSMEGRGHIRLIEGDYRPDDFLNLAKGYEDCPERGARCHLCYELRLREAMNTAMREGYEYFATTLTLSPLKDASVLNETGYRLAEESGGHVLWLPSDFKKEDGYKRSIELSKEYGLYRQNYCGCIYSRPTEPSN